MVVLVIFSVVMAGLYSAYSVSMRQGVKEYRLAESEMELQIAKSIIERDIAMAGFGLAYDYSAVSASINPLAVQAQNSDPDTLTLTGTAIGRSSRTAQAWSYNLVSSPSLSTDLRSWGTTTTYNGTQPYDSSEDLRGFDRVIYMDPNTKKIMAASGNNDKTARTWLFTYPPNEASSYITPTTSIDPGTLVYGLQSKTSGTTADLPYYTVTYDLGGASFPSNCVGGSQSLLRSEGAISSGSGNPQPILNCVLDFQVAFGLDTNEDGTIDCWDNGGVEASGYSSTTLRTRLKQVKVYILVQQGNFDPNFTYSNPDTSDTALTPNQIRVGDLSLISCPSSGPGVGKVVPLNDRQRKYRWRVITITGTPRNMRQ